MMCYTSVNHLFGVNFDGGDECKACGGCYIYPAQCNGTTTFDSIEECQAGTQRGGTRGTPGKGKDKGNVLQTKFWITSLLPKFSATFLCFFFADNAFVTLAIIITYLLILRPSLKPFQIVCSDLYYVFFFL